MKTISLFVLLGATFCLSSCDKPDMAVPEHTKAWLREANGDAVYFRQPATGDIDTLRVELTETNEWRNNPGKLSLGGYHQQLFVLTYTRQKPASAASPLRVLLEFASYGHITLNVLPSAVYGQAAYITSSDNAADELVTGTSYATGELLNQVMLNGRLYSRVAHMHRLYLNAGATPAVVEDVWYSKADGLVAYTYSNGKAWYRQ